MSREIEAGIIDDTGFSTKGRHSVSVARQYCDQLGKQDSCQVALSVFLAGWVSALSNRGVGNGPDTSAAKPPRKLQAHAGNCT
ncbi:transposase [Bradyrhizobium sp. 169]|nr:transposase [Bradyrhizobium sp. 169]